MKFYLDRAQWANVYIPVLFQFISLPHWLLVLCIASIQPILYVIWCSFLRIVKCIGYCIHEKKSTDDKFIHSFSSLSYDRSKASSKASSPRSAIQSFLLQMRVSSFFLKVIQYLHTSSSSSSCHPYPFLTLPSITRCRSQFLRKIWPIRIAFRLRISCRIFQCSLTLSNTSSFLTWSVQLIFSILLQHQISKLSRCFWSTARIVQVSSPYKAMLQM